MMRIGAVNYLNSKPLVYGLEQLAPDVRLCFDLPSRLADSLAAGRLDIALIPSVEFFRTPPCTIVSDACVACRGPVLSVKLYFRVPPAEVRRVALDEGSRTSAALTQILLAELHSIRPQWEPLPIGCGLESTDADAVLLIGDRAIANEERGAESEERGAGSRERGAASKTLDRNGSPDGSLGTESCVPSTEYGGVGEDDDRTMSRLSRPCSTRRSCCEVWDLGERWTNWTGLPFVFAMWVARPDINTAEIAAILTAARDEGVRHLHEIADREAPALEISSQLATAYLRDNLHFALGRKEREGLRRFYQLCVDHQLAPKGLDFHLKDLVHGCPAN